MTTTLSRKERRALQSQAAKAYGLKGEASLQVFQAYEALNAGDAAGAAQLIHPVVQSNPDNVHPWLILGKIALAQRDGATAEAFYLRAVEVSPQNADAFSGLGTSFVLQATKPFEAMEAYKAAIELGSTDTSIVALYKNLMERAGKSAEAAADIRKMAAKSKNPDLMYEAGETYLKRSQFDAAIECYQAMNKMDGKSYNSKVARLKVSFLTHDYEAVIKDGNDLMSVKPSDEIAVMLMGSMRVLGQYDEALSYLENHNFQEPVYYQRALATSANIYRDLDRDDEAVSAYEEALYVTDEEKEEVAKQFGAYKLRHRYVPEGAEMYANRQPASSRAAIPFSNASERNLRSIEKIYLVHEQGIGDQLALLPMAAQISTQFGIKEIFFVCEGRMAELLSGNSLGVTPIIASELKTCGHDIKANEMVYLADLTLHLGDILSKETPLGEYLQTDPENVQNLRQKYLSQTKTGSGKIIGVSWKSKGNISGYARSLELSDILSRLPEDSTIVSLQYGDNSKDIRKAKKKFPKMVFIEDRDIDQLSDMKPFMDQVMALDAVVTIDNTTAHVCGALGKPEAHLLLPAGSERMWYWGPRGDNDLWYRTMTVHSQASARNWLPPLENLQNCF